MSNNSSSNSYVSDIISIMYGLATVKPQDGVTATRRRVDAAGLRPWAGKGAWQCAELNIWEPFTQVLNMPPCQSDHPSPSCTFPSSSNMDANSAYVQSYGAELNPNEELPKAEAKVSEYENIYSRFTDPGFIVRFYSYR